MGAEMALRKNQDSRCPMGLKLVKSSGHHCEPAPFSDLIHNSLKVRSLGDPNPFDVTYEVLHLSFNAFPF
jgi:hypothetical protein